MTTSGEDATVSTEEPLPSLLPYKKRKPYANAATSSDDPPSDNASDDPDVFFVATMPKRKKNSNPPPPNPPVVIDLTLDDDHCIKTPASDVVDLTDTPGSSSDASCAIDPEQSSYILECIPNIASFTLKHCSTSLPKNVQLSWAPKGIRITGLPDYVEKAKRILRNVNWYGDRISYTCPNLSSHYTSDSWTDFIKVLESEIRCTVTLKPDTSTPVSDNVTTSGNTTVVTQKHDTQVSNSSNIIDDLGSLFDDLADKQTASETNCLVIEQRSCTKYGSIDVTVCTGDIVDDNSDVIVNGVGANFDLMTSGAVSQSLLNKAGPELQALCSFSYWSNHTLVRVTEGKNLRCRYVVHLVTSSLCVEDYYDRILLALNCAEHFGAASVALPTLGVGRINLDPASVSKEMRKAVVQFSGLNPLNVKTIKIVVFSANVLPIFTRTIVYSKELRGYGNRRALIAESESDNSHRLETTTICIDSDMYEPVQLAKKKIETHMSKFICRKRLANDVIGMVSDHDCIDIYEAAKDCKARVTCNPTYSEVDLIGLTENVSKLHEFIRDLWCELHEAQTKAKVCKWKWEHEYNEFVELPIRVSCMIEKQYEKSKSGCIEVRLFNEILKINFATMTYNFNSIIARLYREDKTAGGLAELPSHWNDMIGRSWTKVTLESNTTGEYEDVLAKFYKSTPPSAIKIVKVERIQNPSLYKQYLIKKVDVQKHMRMNFPVERDLFHGTSEQDIEKICADGFDRSFAGKNATNYGKGSYFAVNSSYSLNYAKRNSHKFGHMFLAKVLTGDFAQGHSSLKTAPEKQPQSSGVRRLYDSVVDCFANPSMFVVFKDSSVYPAYLITFT